MEEAEDLQDELMLGLVENVFDVRTRCSTLVRRRRSLMNARSRTWEQGWEGISGVETELNLGHIYCSTFSHLEKNIFECVEVDHRSR